VGEEAALVLELSRFNRLPDHGVIAVDLLRLRHRAPANGAKELADEGALSLVLQVEGEGQFIAIDAQRRDAAKDPVARSAAEKQVC
jgi:hypothetical protein